MLNAYFDYILLSFAVKLTGIVDISIFVLRVEYLPEIANESGKLLAIGCHFPSKEANFGTLNSEKCVLLENWFFNYFLLMNNEYRTIILPPLCFFRQDESDNIFLTRLGQLRNLPSVQVRGKGVMLGTFLHLNHQKWPKVLWLWNI